MHVPRQKTHRKTFHPLDQNHPSLQDTGLKKTRFPNKDYVVISENWGPGGKEGPRDLALKSGKASWRRWHYRQWGLSRKRGWEESTPTGSTVVKGMETGTCWVWTRVRGSPWWDQAVYLGGSGRCEQRPYLPQSPEQAPSSGLSRHCVWRDFNSLAPNHHLNPQRLIPEEYGRKSRWSRTCTVSCSSTEFGSIHPAWRTPSGHQTGVCACWCSPLDGPCWQIAPRHWRISCRIPAGQGTEAVPCISGSRAQTKQGEFPFKPQRPPSHPPWWAITFQVSWQAQCPGCFLLSPTLFIML